MNFDRNKLVKVSMDFVKEWMSTHKELMPIFHAFADENHYIFGVPWANEEEKLIAFSGLRVTFKVLGVKSYSYLSEAWIKVVKAGDDFDKFNKDKRMVSEYQDKKEVVMLVLVDQLEKTVHGYDIIRGDNGFVKDLTPMKDGFGSTISGRVADLLPGHQKVVSIEERRMAKYIMETYNLKGPQNS